MRQTDFLDKLNTDDDRAIIGIGFEPDYNYTLSLYCAPCDFHFSQDIPSLLQVDALANLECPQCGSGVSILKGCQLIK